MPPLKKDWRYRTSTEKRLAEALERISGRVLRIANKFDTLHEIAAAIAEMSHSRDWRRFATLEAMRMVKSVAHQSALTWRQAAKQNQNGVKIHRALQSEFINNRAFNKIIRANAEHITKMPDEISRQIVEHAASQARAGKRSAALIDDIREFAPEITINRARLIARTETAKAQAAVTQVRAQQIGLNWYVWRTAEDQRVRSSHAHMEGVICNFSNPPSPEKIDGKKPEGYYGPGEIYNCRCYAEPVIDSSDLPNRVKVVQNGKITLIGKKEFMRLAQ